ncbi:glyoxalase [Agrobacterium vitis]|uniref:VOC family protein n=1 Tax=Agrobacterium vitis TaxID=373 RepID=A0AAE5B7J5_AGRVI|nr:VOC family protein [Agrobacterium vitis]MBF2714124.1 VOC family protein [Agrobacterium vitis]MUO81503.1 glyoxalase [Agrobacterium vitis]MUO95850.1 glyoxalase [Agrobacterium vitis]MVA93929.1 glyoxalase [Agrobacterium vitis]MVB03564.1 glyoxalase [Agrobacterium vitis]
MIKSRRLGYASFSTPRMQEQAEYFKEILGLSVSQRTERKVVLATSCGLESIVLEPGDTAGLLGLAFEIAPAVSLEYAKRELKALGIKAEIREGRASSVGRVVAFHDPEGTEIELFNSSAFLPEIPHYRPISPLKLGHVACQVPNIEDLAEFYVNALGFRKSDWAEGLAVFLRCSPDHHTVNFFSGPSRLDHIAFEVKDFSELVRAADHLTITGYPLEWGPARHSAGHNCASYHFSPDGFPVELYAEMDQMKDEELGYFEPRPWHADRPQRPKNWRPDEFVRNIWSPQPFDGSGPNKG